MGIARESLHSWFMVWSSWKPTVGKSSLACHASSRRIARNGSVTIPSHSMVLVGPTHTELNSIREILPTLGTRRLDRPSSRRSHRTLHAPDVTRTTAIICCSSPLWAHVAATLGEAARLAAGKRPVSILVWARAAPVPEAVDATLTSQGEQCEPNSINEIPGISRRRVAGVLGSLIRVVCWLRQRFGNRGGHAPRGEGKERPGVRCAPNHWRPVSCWPPIR